MSKIDFEECSFALPLKVKNDCIHDDNGRHVAEVCTSSVGRNDDENEYFDNRDRKRAVYIAKCINSHEAVVAALKEANALILAPAEDIKEQVLGRIRAAIARAEDSHV